MNRSFENDFNSLTKDKKKTRREFAWKDNEKIKKIKM